MSTIQLVSPIQPEFAPIVEEAERLKGMRDSNPYDRSVRENLADVLYRLFHDRHEVGTLARSQLILLLISGSFPTPTLSAAYFENLERLFERQPRQPFPGQVVLGLGSGRCGSTSLSVMLAGIKRSCATHENPPLIYWNPQQEQLNFHMRRLKFLVKYFPLVFDAAHWWLWAIDRFFTEFPDGKAIGLHRDTETCVRSFSRVKGQGRGSFNHWVPPPSGVWCTNYWDPTYPTYSLPEQANEDPDAARARLITRYVEEYNTALFALRERLPEQVMLIRTEELALPTVHEQIFEFVGQIGSIPPPVLNAGTVDDSAQTFAL